MKKSYQRGFGLVELMVAMAIGLIIVLGAGQLFLTGLNSFKTVERLGTLQSTLLFASDILVRDIRRADKDSLEGEGEGDCGESAKLCLEIANATECGDEETLHRAYKLSDGKTEDEGYSLRQGHACVEVGEEVESEDWSWQPVATGFATDGFNVSDENGGEWRVDFCLISVDLSVSALAGVNCDAGSDDIISFIVMNRSSVFN